MFFKVFVIVCLIGVAYYAGTAYAGYGNNFLRSGGWSKSIDDSGCYGRDNNGRCKTGNNCRGCPYSK